MILINTIISFLKNPINTTQDKSFTTFRNLVIQYIIYSFLILSIFRILNMIILDVCDTYTIVFNNRNPITNPYFNSCVILIIIAPLVEELTFRLGLKINRLNLAVSLSCNIILTLYFLKVLQLPFIYRFGSILILSIIFYAIINNRIVSFFKSKQNIYIYYNILVFALIHIPNYNYEQYSHYFFIPLLIFPQFMSGIFLSYARLRYGFVLALFLHMLHNLPIVIK